MRSLFINNRVQTVMLILLILTVLNIAGCAAGETNLDSRVVNLEQRLSTAELTIRTLEQRIEDLEEGRYSITEEDILRTLQGESFWARVGYDYMQIKFGECISLENQ